MNPLRASEFSTYVELRNFTIVVLGLLIFWSQLAKAATSTPAPDLNLPAEQSEQEAAANDADRMKSELTTITPAPPVKITHNPDQLEYFYPYRKSMSPRAGVIYDTELYASKRFIYSIGIVYLFPIQKIDSWEAGFDVISDGTGQAHVARRWFWSRGRVRPYYKLGGGLRLVPSQELTTLIRINNFQGRAAIGLERLLAPPLSWRAEFELAAGIKSIQFAINLGYSWAW